jgi:hypothetical protein
MQASGSSGRAGTTEDLGGIVTVSTILYSILTRPSADRLGLSQSSAEPQVGLFRNPVSGNLATDSSVFPDVTQQIKAITLAGIICPYEAIAKKRKISNVFIAAVFNVLF